MKLLSCYLLGFCLSLIEPFVSAKENQCKKCETVVREFKDSMKTGESRIKLYSEKVCVEDKQCKDVTQNFVNMVRILKNRTENVDPTALCTNMEYCPSSGNPQLSSKFVLALAEVITKALDKITSSNNKVYDEFCTQCSYIVDPMTSFFSKNIIALEDKGTIICKEFHQELNVPKHPCEDKITSFITNMKDTKSTCDFICNRKRSSLEKINHETSLAVKQYIEARSESTSQKDKLREIKKQIQESDGEAFPNVLTDDNVNSFCALCVLGTAKLPEVEGALLNKLTTLISGIFLETKDPQLMQRVKEAIKDPVHSLVEYYSATTFCTSSPVYACSQDSYDLVTTFLGKKSKTECNACQTFSAYVGPILKKQGARDDLIDFLTSKVFELLAPSVFDYVNINAKEYVSKAVDFATDYINDDETCKKADFCPAPKSKV